MMAGLSPDAARAAPTWCELPAVPASLRVIRALLAELCTAADLNADDQDTVVLSVNEVAANAIETSDARTMRIRWEVDERRVHVTLAHDGAPGPRCDPYQVNGLGLLIAFTLADEIRIQPSQPQPGTTIRLRFQLPTRTEPGVESARRNRASTDSP